MVLSAVSGTTNKLYSLAHELKAKKDLETLRKALGILRGEYRELTESIFSSDEGKERAHSDSCSAFDFIEERLLEAYSEDLQNRLVIQGEIISTSLFHHFMVESGLRAVLLPALNFMIMDDTREPNISLTRSRIQHILATHPDQDVFITQGFAIRNIQGGVDNLGRGGSDYSATSLGAAVRASEIQIWTDVDGIQNMDPRDVSDTHSISALSFEEASELAYFGAKVLHPRCIIPAMKYEIPVRIKNTMNPDVAGTLITSTLRPDKVKAIASKDGILAIKIKSSRMLMMYGFMRKVFEVFETYKKSVDMVTTSEVAVSLTIDNEENLEHITRDLGAYGKVTVDRNQTVVCLVGDDLVGQKEVLEDILPAVREFPIRMIVYGGSKHNISFLIETPHKKGFLDRLNVQLFQS